DGPTGVAEHRVDLVRADQHLVEDLRPRLALVLGLGFGGGGGRRLGLDVGFQRAHGRFLTVNDESKVESPRSTVMAFPAFCDKDGPMYRRVPGASTVYRVSVRLAGSLRQ